MVQYDILEVSKADTGDWRGLVVTKKLCEKEEMKEGTEDSEASLCYTVMVALHLPDSI